MCFPSRFLQNQRGNTASYVLWFLCIPQQCQIHHQLTPQALNCLVVKKRAFAPLEKLSQLLDESYNIRPNSPGKWTWQLRYKFLDSSKLHRNKTNSPTCKAKWCFKIIPCLQKLVKQNARKPKLSSRALVWHTGGPGINSRTVKTRDGEWQVVYAACNALSHFKHIHGTWWGSWELWPALDSQCGPVAADALLKTYLAEEVSLWVTLNQVVTQSTDYDPACSWFI